MAAPGPLGFQASEFAKIGCSGGRGSARGGMRVDTPLTSASL